MGMDNARWVSNDGRLARFIANQGAARPDVHVQISGTNSALASKSQARQHGACIHCDLGKGAKAFRIVGLNTRYSPVTGQSIHQSVGSLQVFDLTL